MQRILLLNNIFMPPMSIFDYYALEKHFKKFIGKHFDKISVYYGNYKLKLGKDLVIIPGVAVYPTQYQLNCQNPDNFCTYLRKRLKDRKLEKFNIVENQKILELEFDEYVLIIECFAKGNIILCDKDFNILKSLREVENKVYEYPELDLNKAIPPFVKKEAEFLGVKVEDLFYELIKKSKESETLYFYEKTFAPFELQHIEVKSKKPLLDGYDDYFCEHYLTITIVKDEGEKIRKYRQKELEKTEEEIKKYENLLDKIYSNYTLLEELLNKVRERCDDPNLNEILKKGYESGILPFKCKFKKPYLEIEFNE
jgi:predicted ribosome quality control (RQC) complex YloA/Tae2 family protein